MRCIDSLRIENNRLKWRYNGLSLHIIPWGENGLRVIAGYDGTLDAVPLSALLDIEDHPAIFSESETAITIQNGTISARIDMQGRLEFRDQSGKLLLKEMWRQRDTRNTFWSAGSEYPETISALKLPGRDFKPLAGNASQITVSFESDPD
ncbi:hypothetical protein COMNV_00632 [Commensalibacter sp. Nvir]|uniref:hypothetical protein n=1 Tax=Commensalibacter sp. Nvir TaxID=3069817 RepID=UPI002D2E2E79|nr:hypothetical protein COMNV_00632 [Commensalibacter sp. Nvir]